VCTMIAVTRSVKGSGKGPDGWFSVNQATVGYDHATHSDEEQAAEAAGVATA
jgi:hypothetical protein